MVSEKKYSVLMSVYEKENPNNLKESISSVLNQTAKCDEFVLVEDGPLTIELNDVIEKYKKEYNSLFKIIKLEKNVGLGIALKHGILKCNNELVARFDSDDISVPTRCEKQLKEFQNDPELSIVGSNHIEFIDNVNNITSYKNCQYQMKK